MNDLEYRCLKNKVQELTDIDLDDYKARQMRRRLDSFVARHNASDIAAYCDMLDRNTGLLDALRNFLTINVSEFFRDPKSFQILETATVPELLRYRPDLNVWSAGCANGAEAYSIAIILDKLSPCGNHRVLATDIDESSMARGMSGGPYRAAEVRNVPRHRLLGYFTSSKDGYRVIDRLREKVEFRRHNMLHDSYEQGFDLIACRNVLIYLCEKAQSQILQALYQSLRENGILFVGGTETVRNIGQPDFTRLQQCFYRKSTHLSLGKGESKKINTIQSGRTVNNRGEKVKARVLIVDDSAFMRGTLKYMVESAWHTVVGMARDGREAVELYTELKPDLVLLDILMAGMDGLAALRDIRERDAGAKVIMVSALGQEPIRREAKELGAFGYIRKPFEQAEVSDQIDRALLNAQ